LRSCEKETTIPIEGTLSGQIPTWLNGSLLKNGPGKMTIGKTMMNHLFDGMALLHRFYIENGIVTYQCKFLESEAYTSSKKTNELQFDEFGTTSAKNILQK
jgi:carotenoid isomerooxygenase